MKRLAIITAIASVFVALVASAGYLFESDFGATLTGHWHAAEYFARDWAFGGVVVWCITCIASISATITVLVQRKLTLMSGFTLLACYTLSTLLAFSALSFAGSAR